MDSLDKLGVNRGDVSDTLQRTPEEKAAWGRPGGVSHVEGTAGAETERRGRKTWRPDGDAQATWAPGDHLVLWSQNTDRKTEVQGRKGLAPVHAVMT